MQPAAPPASSDWSRRVVARTLPIAPGDRVVVARGSDALTRALREAGASVVRLPVWRGAGSPEAFADHLVVTRLDDGGPPLAEVARCVRPGGSIYVGVGHLWWTRARRNAWTVTRGRRELTRLGFEGVTAYGVRFSLHNPRFLVPLDDPAPLRWYLQNSYLPVTTAGAVGAQVLARAATLPPARLAFPALAFVARRSSA
jgi:hypothetical protein